MKHLEKLAANVLAQNSELGKIYVCADRNVFASENQAKKHCEKRGIEYAEFDRESLSQVKEIKQKASKPKKSTKSKTTKNK